MLAKEVTKQHKDIFIKNIFSVIFKYTREFYLNNKKQLINVECLKSDVNKEYAVFV